MIPEYHKIHTIWKRDEAKVVVPWAWSRPEIDYLACNIWTWTEKVDGTNIRLGIREGSLLVRGRTDNAQIPTALYEAILALDLGNKIPAVCDEPEAVSLYGEGYGPKIQTGGKYRTTPGFVLFDVRVGQWWLRREDVAELGAKLGLDVVPDVGAGTLHDAVALVAPGFQSRWGTFNAEGLVCRPYVDLYARDGSRVIVKVKTRDFDGLRAKGVTW